MGDDIERIYTIPATGKFAPNNPGRPRGSRNLVAHETLRRIKDLRDPALTALAEKVRLGDMAAVALVLQYCLPRGRTVELDSATPDAISEALITGEISTDEARLIALTIEKLRKVRDLDQLQARLVQVEKLLHGD